MYNERKKQTANETAITATSTNVFLGTDRFSRENTISNRRIDHVKLLLFLFVCQPFQSRPRTYLGPFQPQTKKQTTRQRYTLVKLTSDLMIWSVFFKLQTTISTPISYNLVPTCSFCSRKIAQIILTICTLHFFMPSLRSRMRI